MLEVDPSAWTPWTYWLYGFAFYSAGAFVWFWFRFHALERRAEGGDAGAVRAYNRSLGGFPNAVYAKMMGKRKLEVEPSAERVQME